MSLQIQQIFQYASENALSFNQQTTYSAGLGYIAIISSIRKPLSVHLCLCGPVRKHYLFHHRMLTDNQSRANIFRYLKTHNVFFSFSSCWFSVTMQMFIRLFRMNFSWWNMRAPIVTVEEDNNLLPFYCRPASC